jgi:hypothetical protein
MDMKALPNAGVNPQASVDSPFTTFFQLNERSVVPAEYRTAPTFSITRLRSPALWAAGPDYKVLVCSRASDFGFAEASGVFNLPRVGGRQIDQDLNGTFVSIECGRL